MRLRRRRRSCEPPPGPQTTSALRLTTTSASEVSSMTASKETSESASTLTTRHSPVETRSTLTAVWTASSSSRESADLTLPVLIRTKQSRLKGRRWRIPRMPSLLLLFLAFISIPVAAAVKCYCTDDHCVPYGACEGNACLVGILKESNQVIRTCGNQKVGCFRDVDDKWADLCVCEDEFCNTFSFLRQNTQKEKPHTFPQPAPVSSDHDHRSDHSNGNGYFKTHQGDFHDDEDDHLVFHRMDRPDDGPVHNPDAPLATSFVTILLVVVPLTVGALTVVIVAFNYYCHLC